MGQATPLPGPLRLLPAYAFAGRERELAQLRALLPRTVGEGRRAALVAGEPGSGKSRLVRELAGELADEGAIVLYGDCDAVVGSPYAPFATALAELARGGGMGPAVLDGLGASRADLARLVPDLAPARSTRRALVGRGRRAAATPHGRDGAAGRGLGRGARAARARGPPLGRRVDAPPRPPPRPVGRRGAHAGRGDVPGHRGGRRRRALRGARGRVPHRRRGPDPARRPRRRASSRSSSAWPPEPSRRRSSPASSATSPAATPSSSPSSGASSSTRERSRSGRPSARLVRPASELGTPATVREVANQRLQRLSAPGDRAARARRGRRRRLRARDHPPRRGAGGGGPPGCGRRGRPRRAARRASGNRARVPVHARARSDGRSSDACPPPEPPSSTFASPGRSSTAACVPTGQPSSPRSPTTTRPLPRSATSHAPSR